jgi:hypothetical protein
MAVMSYLYPTQIKYGMFVGDDSLLFGNDFADRTEEAANMLNLESKFYKYDSLSFCSKFIIDVGNYVRVVPDLLKVVTKLGRTDLINDEHIERYRVSLADNIKSFSDSYIDGPLSMILFERYKCELDVGPLLTAILYVVRHPEQFRELYYAEEGAIIKEGIPLPSLEV